MSADKRQLEQYYAFLAGHTDEVRRMQHDILHHLRVMSGYAQAGNYDRLKEYLDALVEQMPDMDGLYYCGDHAANILLKYYGEQARNGGIRFNCDAQIPPDLPCTPVDLCTVLGNAMQNAVEACQRQGRGAGRYISLLARLVGHNLIMEIRNSYDGRVKWDGDRLVTLKEEHGHGLGLDSIRHVAERYHGYCAVSHTDDEFTVKVVLALEWKEATPC